MGFSETATVTATMPYRTRLPEKAPVTTHFSNLLFSGSPFLTGLELCFLGSLYGVSVMRENLNVCGSFSLYTLFVFFAAQSLIRRAYNSYLEACFFAFPSLRTQPDHEHKLIKSRLDLNGRQAAQLAELEVHDLGTFLSVNCLEVAVYFLLPGYYPSPDASAHGLLEKAARLVGNHLVMSFSMYWLHRSAHAVPFLWRIHSIHHYAKHPLSRNTYEDHWFDNFSNAIVGHLCAQVLVPLDFSTFLFSHVFRIAESLEKHSGLSSWLNLAHQFTVTLVPWAQMPHHHDWHHEGFKGSNFTFSSIGGVWDCLFQTRHEGRTKRISSQQSTHVDKAMAGRRAADLLGRGEKNFFDTAVGSLAPLFLVLAAAVYKLHTAGYTVGAAAASAVSC